jgi:hypothetical protein
VLSAAWRIVWGLIETWPFWRSGQCGWRGCGFAVGVGLFGSDRLVGRRLNRPGFGAASCLAKDADHGEEVPG